MKQLISLIAISFVSVSAFAGIPASTNASSAAALGAAWKHQNAISVDSHNFLMIGGQDVVNQSVLDGPVSAA